jgi:hypothetical protein
MKGKDLNEIGLFMSSLMVTDYRDKLYSSYESIRENFLIRSIIEVMTDDILNTTNPEQKILSFTSKNASFKKELNEWSELIDWDSLISDIIPDILLFGEYALKPRMEGGKGIVALDEVYDINNIVPVYEGNNLKSYVVNVMGEENPFATKQEVKFEEVDANEYLYFVRSGKRIKVRFGKKFIEELTKWGKDKAKQKDLMKLIAQLRIGRSIIPYKLIPTIKSLETLNTILPVMRFLQLDRRVLVGVRVPPALKPENIVEMMRNYERVINESTGSSYNSTTGDIDVQSLVSRLSKYRVVPIQGEKGEINTQEIPTPEVKDLADAEYLIDTVFTGIGFPKEYLMPGVEASNLKQYVRYLKMIASIQYAIQKTAKRAALIHLNAKNMNAVPDDIDVQFETAISIENIDELEYVDILNNLLGNYTNSIETLQQIEGVPEEAIDWDEVLRFLHGKLKNFRGAEAFLSNYVKAIKNKKPRKINIKDLEAERDDLDQVNKKEKQTPDIDKDKQKPPKEEPPEEEEEEEEENE